jgi:hypothetical protein
MSLTVKELTEQPLSKFCILGQRLVFSRFRLLRVFSPKVLLSGLGGERSFHHNNDSEMHQWGG